MSVSLEYTSAEAFLAKLWIKDKMGMAAIHLY